jgi:hypothetical protein
MKFIYFGESSDGCSDIERAISDNITDKNMGGEAAEFEVSELTL